MFVKNRCLSTAAVGIAVVILTLGTACSPSSTQGTGGSSDPAPAGSTARTPDEAPAPEGTAASAPTDSVPAAEPVRLTDEELAEGWISLFDGQTMFGWKPTSGAEWKIADGALVVESGEPGLLCTTTQFSDYVLKLDFRSDKGTNSGIFLHTPSGIKGADMDVETECYELNIADSDNPFPTGSLVKRQKAEGDFESTDWQSYEVTVEGGKVTVKLDGEQIVEYEDPAPIGRGHIGLQLNHGKVAFRNIKLKPLGTADIFNGKDLTGWKTYPDMASKFTVTEEGFMNVKDGKGQLETEGQYGDFVLQLECITHAENLNSGIFFRCIPGDTMNGYESQIHNGFEDDDRTKPMDCGTGGIFRRQAARRVVADDLKWFHKTLIADGAHVAAWVNGYQVSDWTDEREPDENPRKGLRLEAGTIQIQGHDPTTDISFRNFRIVEMAERKQ